MANRSGSVVRFNDASQPIVNKDGSPTTQHVAFLNQAFNGLGTVLQAPPVKPVENTFWVQHTGGFLKLQACVGGIVYTLVSVVAP